MNILTYLKQLDLNPEDYIVIGSGIMAAKGLKAMTDIDLLVSPKLFAQLSKRGWQFERATGEEGSFNRLRHGPCEAFVRFRNKSFADWKAQTELFETIEGIQFLSLSSLLDIKTKWHRPKDAADRTLIENYLKKEKPL